MGDLPPPRIGAGRAVVTARVARVHGHGDELVYPWGLERRDEKELRSIVAQLVGLPIVAPHPDAAPPHFGMVGRGAPANMVGRIARAWVAREPVTGVLHAYADLELHSPGILDHWDEMSLGYESGVDDRGYQFGTRVDHLAIVPRARCGETCAARVDEKRTDCACAIPGACQSRGTCHTVTGNARNVDHHPEETMDPEKLNETIRSLGEQLASEKARADKAEKSAADEKLRADTATGQIIELEKREREAKVQMDAQSDVAEREAVKVQRERADAAEALIAKFDEKFEERVQSRVQLERKAAAVMGTDYAMLGLDDRTIMATVVKRLDSDADVSERIEIGVIRGRFLAATERFDSGARAVARMAEASARSDARDDLEDRRTARAKRGTEPLPSSKLKSN